MRTRSTIQENARLERVTCLIEASPDTVRIPASFVLGTQAPEIDRHSPRKTANDTGGGRRFVAFIDPIGLACGVDRWRWKSLYELTHKRAT